MRPRPPIDESEALGIAALGLDGSAWDARTPPHPAPEPIRGRHAFHAAFVQAPAVADDGGERVSPAVADAAVAPGETPSPASGPDGDSDVHSASALGEAFEAYLLPRGEMESSLASARQDPLAQWTAYLPTDGIDECDAKHEYLLGDEESHQCSDAGSPPRPPSHLPLSHMLQSLAQFRRAAPKDAHRDAAGEEWIALQEHAQDGTASSAAPKPLYQQLRGKTLMYFGPTNAVRVLLARLLSTWWVEPVILALITINLVVLIISSSHDAFTHPVGYEMLSGVEQVILLVVFGLYTVEMVARIIVSGLVIDPPPLRLGAGHGAEARVAPHESNTRAVLANACASVRDRYQRAVHPYGALNQEYLATNVAAGIAAQMPATEGASGHPAVPWTGPCNVKEHGLFRTFSHTVVAICLRFSRAITGDPHVLVERAYLRHSWHRVDAIAIVCFWIAVILEVAHAEKTPHRHIFLFRAVSVLRCARLLALPEGIAAILVSLKRVAPMLLRVAYFIGFFIVLFAVIGIQSFKGSYRRQCVWIGDMNREMNTNVTLNQLCGGSYDPQNSSRTIGHVVPGLDIPMDRPKGYLCPYGQLCMQLPQNPSNNVQSFDNIFASLLQVFIVISLNGWSNTMYDMIDADYYTACIFFIFGIILLNFWLANLFVAVISHSFASISAQTDHSAFSTAPEHPPTPKAPVAHRGTDVYKRAWSWTKYVWLAAVIASVSIQGSQNAYQYPHAILLRHRAERYLTLAFDVEIVCRFASYALDRTPRQFLRKKHNALDLFLAVLTTLIQIPPIRNSHWYPWLTFFQLARFYRVIAAIPRMRILLIQVVGSMNSLFNMVAFLLMVIFMAALFSVQLFHGDVPPVNEDGDPEEMTWKHLYNGFLAVYQIFSSENWTDPLLNVLASERYFHQAVIAGIFLVGWFIFANFIVLQMFVAVINENFRVPEGEKYKRQMERYLMRSEPPRASKVTRVMQRFSPFQRDAMEPREAGTPSRFMQLLTPDRAGQAVGTLQRVLRLDHPREHSHFQALHTTLTPDARPPLDELHTLYSQSAPHSLVAGLDHIKALRASLGLHDTHEAQKQFLDEYVERAETDPRIQMARVIAEHPWYDRSWFLFSNRNPIRRFCQSLTPCSYGERMFGREMSKVRYYIFQSIIFAAIVGSVVAAGIATPLYRKKYFALHGQVFANWFSVIELSLSVIFVLEFFVKTIADGFVGTPNAYVLSVWNLLDLIVLVSLLVNVISELVVIGGVSHFTRAIKALRALRLINLSSLMRDTFHAVMIAGAGRIFDAALLALLYIIPYAVWGQNLFAGLLYSCNDQDAGILTKLDCHGEYASSPVDWAFLAPRVWQNPTKGSMYSFDDFKSSLLILFEIVSLEGWINVMTQAMQIVGRDQQPQTDASPHNALFFLIYNLIGAVSVLTLFVSVIIENFQWYSGAAFLTTAQRQWLDLKRQIKRQTASKRPKHVPHTRWARWCYDAATKKQGWWLRSMTVMHLCILVVLMTQEFDDPPWTDRLRNAFYVAFGSVYLVDILVRLVGLGFTGFRRNWWNWYDVMVMAGVLGTSIPLAASNGGSQVHAQLQKIFLTGVALKLVQRIDALNQLFKMAIGSVPAIFSLFLLWLTMFFVWGIMLVEVFGLTKWGANETHAKNLSSLWGTLVFLLMTSTGEGWNSYMHDYTVQSPMCTSSKNYLDSDCGSKPWAYFLFITWNIISMFIFLNMFTGTVVENFSYVFHLQGSTDLSRGQMRLYKDAWTVYDHEGWGFIQQKDILPFLARLRGLFEVGLYPPGYTVPELLAETQRPDGRVDTAQLAAKLAELRPADLRMRRTRLNRMYHEAVLADKGKGVSFTSMLFILAYHKMCMHPTNMEVSEFIERRTRMDEIDNKIRLERLRGLLYTVYLRRKFLARTRTRPPRPTLSVSIPRQKDDTDVLPSPSSLLEEYYGDMGDAPPTLSPSPLSTPVRRRVSWTEDPADDPFASATHWAEQGAWQSVLRRLSPGRARNP